MHTGRICETHEPTRCSTLTSLFSLSASKHYQAITLNAFLFKFNLSHEVMASKSEQMQLFQKHMSHIRQMAFVVDVIRLVMLVAFMATRESFLRIFCPLVIFISVLSLVASFACIFDMTMESDDCCGRDMGKGQKAKMFGVKPSRYDHKRIETMDSGVYTHDHSEYLNFLTFAVCSNHVSLQNGQNGYRCDSAHHYAPIDEWDMLWHSFILFNVIPSDHNVGDLHHYKWPFLPKRW